MIGNSTDQSEIEPNLFAEPFTELWKKLLGTIAFILNSIGCVIMLTFVGLERQGFGSHYRTALNQLNSWILIFVSIASCHPLVSMAFSRFARVLGTGDRPDNQDDLSYLFDV